MKCNNLSIIHWFIYPHIDDFALHILSDWSRLWMYREWDVKYWTKTTKENKCPEKTTAFLFVDMQTYSSNVTAGCSHHKSFSQMLAVQPAEKRARKLISVHESPQSFFFNFKRLYRHHRILKSSFRVGFQLGDCE